MFTLLYLYLIHTLDTNVFAHLILNQNWKAAQKVGHILIFTIFKNSRSLDVAQFYFKSEITSSYNSSHRVSIRLSGCSGEIDHELEFCFL